MNRRQFSKLFALSSLALGTRRLNASQRTHAPQIAITMDDFNWRNAVHQTAIERNRSILATLNKYSIKAALFVIGRNVESAEGKQLLAEWNNAGHLIGNHTYSHQSLNAPAMTVAAYTEDILRAEKLLNEFSRFKKYFRFPMLREGETAAKRDGVRTFLTKANYRVGHVTIDTDDWVITSRLTERLNREPSADVKAYRDFYLAHMWDRAQYYDSLSHQTLGRSVKHTILVHYNLLNGLFLDDLIGMFKSKGWQLIDVEEAFTDTVFSAKPKVLPAGQSIIWGLAKSDPIISRTLKYPAETGDDILLQMQKLGL
jgi:peptidoglycan/xylan/chitin deacetylase (PgdA/CDA1 family)